MGSYFLRGLDNHFLELLGVGRIKYLDAVLYVGTRMETSNQSTKVMFSEWKYSFVGGVMSIPLTIGYNWYFELGYYSFVMVIIGGMIAGYLAKRNSLREYYAGIGAGVIGSLPGFMLAFRPLYNLASEWTASGAVILTTIVVPLVVLFLFAIGAMLGFIGGGVGGWIATKFNGRRASHTPTQYSE